MITSDPYRMGVNISAMRTGESNIELVVTNQNNKLLGRANKKLLVVD